MKIYLDVCCLCRPFDEQTQEKVRLESQVIIRILKLCARKRVGLIWSEMLDFEIGRIPDFLKHEKISAFVKFSEANIALDDELRDRAKEFQQYFGIQPQDAFHLACAEKSAATFLTTDEKMLKKIKKGPKILKIKAMNPVDWFMKAVLI